MNMPYNEGKYECKLSPWLQEKALKELNEEPARREEAFEILRQWIKKQPHINGRTDDAFLLKFLRQAKFSIEKAKQRIDNFYTMKTAIPEWFFNLDVNDPKLVKVIKAGVFLPLGYDEEGKKVIIYRMGVTSPSELKVDDFMKVNSAVSEWLLFDEQTQICGCVFISDLTGMTGAHMAQWTPMVAKKSMTFYQECMPIRMKGLHYWKTPTFFEKLFNLFKVFMSEKLQSRIQIHGSNVESLQKTFPLEILPKEYGGQGESIETIAENIYKEVMAYRQFFQDEDKYNVDESKRPGKPKTKEDLFGLDGTFRKLDID